MITIIISRIDTITPAAISPVLFDDFDFFVFVIMATGVGWSVFEFVSGVVVSIKVKLDNGVMFYYFCFLTADFSG